jgi:hypothetical protein
MPLPLFGVQLFTLLVHPDFDVLIVSTARSNENVAFAPHDAEKLLSTVESFTEVHHGAAHLAASVSIAATRVPCATGGPSSNG